MDDGGDVRDLVDFCLRWPEFRQAALGLAARPDLAPVERRTIAWLVLLADRIGAADLEPDDAP